MLWLLSRNGNRLKRFARLESALAAELRAIDVILDGEIVCLDPKDGRSVFADRFNTELSRTSMPSMCCL